MKKDKPVKQWHTPKSNMAKGMGMGDNYGSGKRNNVGIARDVTTAPKMTNKQLGKPPRSIA